VTSNRRNIPHVAGWRKLLTEEERVALRERDRITRRLRYLRNRTPLQRATSRLRDDGTLK